MHYQEMHTYTTICLTEHIQYMHTLNCIMSILYNLTIQIRIGESHHIHLIYSAHTCHSITHVSHLALFVLVCWRQFLSKFPKVLRVTTNALKSCGFLHVLFHHHVSERITQMYQLKLSRIITQQQEGKQSQIDRTALCPWKKVQRGSLPKKTQKKRISVFLLLFYFLSDWHNVALKKELTNVLMHQETKVWQWRSAMQSLWKAADSASG